MGDLLGILRSFFIGSRNVAAPFVSFCPTLQPSKIASNSTIRVKYYGSFNNHFHSMDKE